MCRGFHTKSGPGHPLDIPILLRFGSPGRGGGTAWLTPYPNRGSRPGYCLEGRATGTQDNRISPFCSNPDSHISEDFTISPHCGSVLVNFWFPNPLGATATVFRETLWSLAKVSEFGFWLKRIPMLPSLHQISSKYVNNCSSKVCKCGLWYFPISTQKTRPVTQTYYTVLHVTDLVNDYILVSRYRISYKNPTLNSKKCLIWSSFYSKPQSGNVLGINCINIFITFWLCVKTF